MTLNAHFATVQDRHLKLESSIAEEARRPYPDIGLLQTMKKQKLLLKALELFLN